MNRLLEDDYLEQQKDIVDDILTVENNYHSKPKDALIKWSGIVEGFKSLHIKPQVTLDVGCGLSSLPIYFKRYSDTVIGVDTSCNHEFKHKLEKNGITFIHSALEHAVLPDESVDLVVDSCAIGCSMNLNIATQVIYNKLKHGGYFITVGDVCLTTKDGVFPSPDTWIRRAQELGFELVGEMDENTESKFLTMENPKLYVARMIFRKK